MQEIINKLKTAGLKVTPQRIAVMSSLHESTAHPTAEELFRKVSQTIPGLSVTTVYNILDILVKREVIVRVKTDAGVMRYDPHTDSHHHLYDENSTRLEDYHDPELDQILNKYFQTKNIKGFKLKDIKLQLVGAFEK